MNLIRVILNSIANLFRPPALRITLWDGAKTAWDGGSTTWRN